MRLLRLLAEYFLIQELKNNDFTISGYKNSMVRILGQRFLNDSEVALVHKWKSEGKIVEVGTWSVIGHGGTYSDKTYRYKKLRQTVATTAKW